MRWTNWEPPYCKANVSPWSSYSSSSIRTQSESNSKLGDSSTPKAYNCYTYQIFTSYSSKQSHAYKWTGKSKVLHILNLRIGNGKAEDFAVVQPSPLSRHFSWESRQFSIWSRNSMPFMRLHSSFYYIFSSPPLHPIQSHLNPVHSVLYLISFNIYRPSIYDYVSQVVFSLHILWPKLCMHASRIC